MQLRCDASSLHPTQEGASGECRARSFRVGSPPVRPLPREPVSIESRETLRATTCTEAPKARASYRRSLPGRAGRSAREANTGVEISTDYGNFGRLIRERSWLPRRKAQDRAEYGETRRGRPRAEGDRGRMSAAKSVKGMRVRGGSPCVRGAVASGRSHTTRRRDLAQATRYARPAFAKKEREKPQAETAENSIQTWGK